MGLDIDKLSLKVEASSDNAEKKLDRLIVRLETLKKSVGKLSGLDKLSEKLNKIAASANAISGVDKLAKLVESVSKLSQIKSPNVTKTVNSIKKLSEACNAVSGMSNVSVLKENITAITEACKPMQEMGKNNLSPFLNSLKKIPDITKSLDTEKINEFATRIRQLTSAIEPLTTQVSKAENGLVALNGIMKSSIARNGNLASANAVTVKSYTSLSSVFKDARIRAAALYVTVNRAADALADCLQSSNEYVENINLFTVAMGDYSEEAYRYAEKVNNLLGIDISEWIRFQGVFKQITTGFGVAAEKSNIMSKNLTQIGYDIASFFNISIEDAMQKVESGISGELEPLRRLGYALDAATLQQIAYDNGIQQNINTMTQAQKSQLRYVAILQQSTNVMGDMARTIVTPANSMRILQQQFEQLKRAIGNIVSVFAVKMIPYVQVFVRLLTDAANAIAKWLGFELPTIDYSEVGKGLSSVTENADDATESVKETKKALLALASFDEINQLNLDKNNGNDSGDTTGNKYDLGIDLPEYDFLAGLDKQTDALYKKIKAQLKELYNWLKKHKDMIKVIAGLLATVWAVNKIANLINWVKKLKGAFGALKIVKDCTSWLSKLKAVGVGAISGIVGGFAGFDFFKKLAKGTLDWNSALVDTGIAVGAIAAAFAIGGPIAGAVAIVGTLTGAFIGLYKGARDAKMEIVGLSDNGGTKISEIAEAFGAQCDKIIEAKKAVSEYKETITSNQNKIDQAVGNLNDFGDRLSGLKGKLTDADKENITSGFETIATAIKDNIGAETQGIIDNFKSAMDGLPDNLKTNIQSSISELNALNSQLSGNVDKAQQSINDYYNTIWNGGTPTDEQTENFNKATKYFLSKSVETSDAYKEYKENLSKIDLSKIDFEDFDTFKSSIQDVQNNANSAITAISNAKKDSLDYIESLYQETIEQHDLGWVSDAQLALAKETFENAKKNINDSADEQTKSVKDGLGKILGQAQSQLNTAIDDQAQFFAQQETTNVYGDYLQWTDDAWKYFNDSYSNNIKEQKKNFSDQQDVIKKAAKDTKVNLGEYVKALSPSNIDLNHADIGGWGKVIAAKKGAKTGDWTDYGKEMAAQLSKGIELGTDGTIKSVKGMTSSLLNEFTLGGENCVAGFANALSDKEKKVFAAANDLGLSSLKSLKLALDEHSPSRETHQIGVFFLQGFMNGIKSLSTFMNTYVANTAKSAVTTFDTKSTTTSIGIKFIDRFKNGIDLRKNSLINDIVDIFNTILDKADSFHVQFFNSFNSAVPAIQIASNGILAAMGQAVSIPQISYTAPGYRVQGYARGGYPATGQLFVARENGTPEMVGSIGSRNAVANNDQITAAISQAVYQAVREANRDTQNSGSRNNEMTVKIVPDKNSFVKVAVDGINDTTRRTGKSPLH